MGAVLEEMNNDFPSTSPSPLSQAEVPPGTRVYAIGDIHGRMDLLGRLLEDVAEDAAYAPYEGGAPERLVLVYLGDLVDRGPDSRAVVERLIAGPGKAGPLAGATQICLRGNHEDYLMQFLADFSAAPAWFRVGGLEAIRSYLGHLPDGYVQDHPALQRLFYRSLPPSHLRFLSRMPLKHVEGDYLFAHAGIRPGVTMERQDAFDLMWIREPFLSHAGALGKVVVHGHTVVAEPDIRANRIAIDTGAYRTGRLTCLVLEGAGRRFLST